jgi:hypothetical protein
MKIFTHVIQFIVCLTAFQNVKAQTQVSPKYSVDRNVTSLLSKGDTLIVAGTFSNVGIYTGGGALFKDTTDKPNTSFPKIVGNIYCSTSDGNGGFYIYGNYRRESEATNAVSDRIEHVLSNSSFESGFSIAINSLFKLSSITYNNNVLYIGGENVNQIAGQIAGNLSALDVSTKLLLPWIPIVNGKVTGTFVSQNRLFVIGGFTTIGGQSRNGIAAVEINTGVIKPWNPSLGGGYSDIKFYQNKIVLGGGFHDASFNNHACALVDSITGSTVQYIFNSSNLYWAAGISKIALKGDTLFAFSTGTADTRVTAVKLSNNTILWKKYFNMIATASGMEVIDTSLFVAGTSFDAIYRTNLTNSNAANIERNIKGAVKLSINSGDLMNWFPDPVGLVVRDVNTMSSTNNNIFIGGNFSHVNGLQRQGILMLNTLTDEVLPFKIDFDYLYGCNALKLIDSTLYMAGDISTINGQSYSASVLSCNVRTGTILSWHPVKLGNAWVIEANSKYVFLGGSLTEPAGGSGRTKLFAIDRQTGALANWAPNPNYNISSNSLHIAKGRLYVGGDFTNISGQNRSNLVSYDTATLSLTSWTPSVQGAVTALTSTDTSIWVASSSFGSGSNYTRLFAGLSPQTGMITDSPIPSQPVSGQANSLVTKGRYVIAGGNFSINNSICNYLSMYDVQSKNIVPNGTFCQSFTNGGSINTMAIANNDLYIAGNFVTLNGKLNSTNIERIKYPIGYFDATTDTTYSFYPRVGGNGGDVTINFYGGIIQAGMKLKLVAAGLPDIIVSDSAIISTGSFEMKARVDLRQKAIGKYDVVLTSTSGTEYRKIKSFEIIQFIKPEIKVQVLGTSLIRTGSPSPFVIQITNTGNCDAVGVPLYIYAPSNLTLKFNSIVGNLNGSIKDTLMYAVLDSVLGTTDQAKVYWLLVPSITAGSSKNIRFDVKTDINNQRIKIIAAVNNPLFNSPLPAEQGACFQAIWDFVRNTAVNEINSAFVGCFNNSYNVFHTLLETVYNNAPVTTIDAMDFGSSVVGALTNCTAIALPQVRSVKLAYDWLGKANDLVGTGLGGAQIAEKCKDKNDPTENNVTHNSTSGNSIDPNDKVGIGVTSKHYVNGINPIIYGIRFENIAAAFLPAQTVKVIDTLDKNKLDISTFQLNYFNVSGKYYNISPGQTSKIQFVDLRPQRNLILKVNAALDTLTGIFKAEFTSLDPSTLQLTTNPLLGFLPPNVTAPEGEGGIYFTIHAKPDLPNKTIINNKALIYFDTNLPISTPVWSNTLDKVAPTSKVNDLPATTSDTVINLSWQGTDGESGIEKYNIYYNVNGRSYKQLYLKSGITSTTFIGKMDSTYSFYSVAIDSVGNKEVKTPFDTKTTITSNQDVIIYPNPNNGSFIVQSTSGHKISALMLYDIQGRQIDIKYTGPDNKLQVVINNHIPAGMYILKIQIENKIIGRKILLSK